MKIQSVSKDEFRTTDWSGGTTTEFYIYPEGSDYRERKFKARISSALVTEEQSTFTKLTDVTRYLVPLSEEITLCIRGENVRLSPYEVIRFSGEDAVESYGTCQDFNLMLKNTDGMMESVYATERGMRITVNPGYIAACYCYEGEAMLVTEDNQEIRFASDQLVLLKTDSLKEEIIKLYADHKHVIICHIAM